MLKSKRTPHKPKLWLTFKFWNIISSYFKYICVNTGALYLFIIWFSIVYLDYIIKLKRKRCYLWKKFLYECGGFELNYEELTASMVLYMAVTIAGFLKVQEESVIRFCHVTSWHKCTGIKGSIVLGTQQNEGTHLP